MNTNESVDKRIAMGIFCLAFFSPEFMYPRNITSSHKPAVIAICDTIYSSAKKVNPDTQIEFMGQSRSPLTALAFRNNHALLHYGNVIIYMRLRGKVPPSS